MFLPVRHPDDKQIKIMKISILTANLSTNSLGRVYILAEALMDTYDVEIAGFMRDKTIWLPLAGENNIPYKYININNKNIPIRKIKELYKKIDGDIIYLAKPLFYTFIIALMQKIFRHKPVVIDIDDWELGFFIDSYIRSNKSLKNKIIFFLKEPVRFFFRPSKSFLWFLLIEKMTGFANHITVPNKLLGKKFGGTIVRHGRDPDILNPEKFDKYTLRQKHGLDKDSKIIMFFGTIRRHKGLKVLIDAADLIKDKTVKIAIVGVSANKGYCRNLIEYGKEKLGERFVTYGMQPFKKIAEFISMADIIAVPQQNSYSSIWQTPAKITDAMAMAKPIIATSISDLPDILEGCGWTVETGNPQQLADRIIYILNHKEEAIEAGSMARQKFLNEFSINEMEKTLLSIFRKYEAN
jgi:glycosyltransferase involved in cell wall biosynthesis